MNDTLIEYFMNEFEEQILDDNNNGNKILNGYLIDVSIGELPIFNAFKINEHFVNGIEGEIFDYDIIITIYKSIANNNQNENIKLMFDETKEYCGELPTETFDDKCGGNNVINGTLIEYIMNEFVEEILDDNDNENQILNECPIDVYSVYLT